MDYEIWSEIGDSILKNEGTTLIQSFLDKGLDVNAMDDDGITMLACAVKCDNMEIIEFLIQNGADANISNHGAYGMKPIHWAAFYGYKGIVMFFLNKGFDIDCRDSDDLTVLHNASEGGHFDLVKFLVSNKCAIDAKSYSGMTPFLLTAVHKHFDIVKYLVESGADVNCRTGDGMGALHFACFEEGSPDVVDYLLKKGCDPNAQNNSQYTPLHYAALDDNFEIIEHLLKAGADCNVKNENGATPLSLLFQSPLCVEGIALLLENGAYFQSNDYNFISDKPLFEVGILSILKDVKLCTQSLVNKFNHDDLPKAYEIPEVAQRLPPIEKMRIASYSNMKQSIAESVKYEIETKGYCNILNVRPIVLYSLCVKSLIQRHGD